MATKDRTALKDEFKNGNLATGERFVDLIDSMKVVQEPVADPATSGTSLSFIASIEQDADGRVSATKKTLDLANAHELNPFKGWYKTGDTLPTSGFDGAYLYFKDTSELTGQTTIYRWNGTAYADTGTVVDTSNVNTFETGQAVSGVAIDNSGLANPAANALAKAGDVMGLAAKLDGVTLAEAKVDAAVGTNVTMGKYVSGETGLLVTPGSSASSYGYFETVVPDGTRAVRFSAGTKPSGYKLGYSVGHYDNGTYVPSRNFLFADAASPSALVDTIIELQDGENVFRATCATPASVSQLTVADFYCYLRTGKSVAEMVPEVVDNLDSNDPEKALSARQGNEINTRLFGSDTETTGENVKNSLIGSQLRIGNTTNMSDTAISFTNGSTTFSLFARQEDIGRGNKLYIKAGTNYCAYMVLAKSFGSELSTFTMTLQQLVDGGYLAEEIHHLESGWKSAIAILQNESAEIELPEEYYGVLIAKQLIGSNTQRPPSEVRIVSVTHTDGVIDTLMAEDGGDAMLVQGCYNKEGKLEASNRYVTTRLIPYSAGYYVAVQPGYKIDRIHLFNDRGEMVNYYERTDYLYYPGALGIAGSNVILPQYGVRLRIAAEDGGNVSITDNVISKFMLMADSRLHRIIPNNAAWGLFQQRVKQMTALTWLALEKIQSTPVRDTEYFMAGTQNRSLPYSEAAEYDKYVGQHVSFTTFLTALLNRRSVMYTEGINSGHTKTKYGYSYHGLGDLSSSFYGTVCTGLTSYVAGLINVTVSSSWNAVPGMDAIARGLSATWGKKVDGEWVVATAEEIAAFVEPMDFIWNDGHCSVISDILVDDDGVRQFVCWTEQVSPHGKTTPYTMGDFIDRLKSLIDEGKTWYIYRYSNWGTLVTNNEFATDDDYREFIQVSPMDYSPLKLASDKDITTFAGEYAAFCLDTDGDGLGSYNNYKAFLNIHRGGGYDRLQIFAETDDEATATPVAVVDISANDGTFIYNSDIYPEDAASAEDWIVVDLTQLSTPLSHGKYKARVVSSSAAVAASGFTHFEMVDLSFTATRVTGGVEIAFSSSEGTPYLVRREKADGMAVSVAELTESDVTAGVKTLTWTDYSTYKYLKLFVKTDWGVVVKRIDLS